MPLLGSLSSPLFQPEKKLRSAPKKDENIKKTVLDKMKSIGWLSFFYHFDFGMRLLWVMYEILHSLSNFR